MQVLAIIFDDFVEVKAASQRLGASPGLLRRLCWRFRASSYIVGDVKPTRKRTPEGSEAIEAPEAPEASEASNVHLCIDMYIYVCKIEGCMVNTQYACSNISERARQPSL